MQGTPTTVARDVKMSEKAEAMLQFDLADFTDDLRKCDVPALIIHGDDDQIVPIGASAHVSVALMPRATLKVYKGAPHGLAVTHRDELNADLLSFLGARLPNSDS